MTTSLIDSNKDWGIIDSFIASNQANGINSALESNSSLKAYYSSLVRVLIDMDENKYLNLKTLMTMNISKEVENLLMSLIPYLFYLYIWQNKYPHTEEVKANPLIDIIAVSLHSRFVVIQNQERYNVESYMKDLQNPYKEVIPEPIKIQPFEKASYSNFDQNYCMIFRDLLQLYIRNSLKMIEESRVYILGAISLIYGYNIKPVELVENNERISQLRTMEKKDFVGICIEPDMIEILLLCIKNLDDTAYVKRKDTEFALKLLKSKAYSEFWFQTAMIADIVEDNMIGLDEFNF